MYAMIILHATPRRAANYWARFAMAKKEYSTERVLFIELHTATYIGRNSAERPITRADAVERDAASEMRGSCLSLYVLSLTISLFLYPKI